LFKEGEYVAMAAYLLEPALPRGDVVAGDPAGRAKDKLILGKIIESGPTRRLVLDITGEQVVAILGKRGTGKSYTLGVLIEGLAAGQGDSDIACLHTPRAGLVLDIMDIFWTSTLQLTDGTSPEISRQRERLRGQPYKTRELNIDVWIPAGFERKDIDPEGLKQLRIQPHSLDLDDWADLFSVDIYGEPRGMLISDLVSHVSDKGYVDLDGVSVSPKADFTFQDLLTCLDRDSEISTNFRDDTRRSIRQRISSYAGLDLFSGVGTALTDMLSPFRVSVLMLSRVPDELKKIIVSVLLKRILRERGRASFATKRLDLDAKLNTKTRQELEQVVAQTIPRTWVLLDEAHVLAGSGESSAASAALIKYAKEGRNYGLSMAVATQQPSALDSRLTSQAETMIVHQLTSPSDAAIATQNVRSPLPSEIRVDGEKNVVETLLRRLAPGEVAFSCGNAPNLSRVCIGGIRPRISAHGGYEA
jgi:uncharacterized protein